MATNETDNVSEQLEECRSSTNSPLNQQSFQQDTRENLEEDIERLKQEIETIEKIIEDEECYNSSSRDARKMYGDVTPGDITHQDVTLEYTNHFKHAFRNMPKAFQDENKFQVWQMCADIVQASFDVNKEQVIETMKKDLENALDLEQDKPGPLSESKKDLHRAFKMMIDLSDDELKSTKEKVSKVTGVDMKTCNLVMDMILKLDPADYNSFITKGELRDRKEDLKHKPAQSQLK